MFEVSVFMSYNSLQEVVTQSGLTASKLRRFKKDLLEQLCSESSIYIPGAAEKQPLKEDYIKALLKAVSHKTGWRNKVLTIDIEIGSGWGK
jgi:hypothetical protein